MKTEIVRQALQPVPVHDLEIMAKRVAQSRLFGLDEAQAFTLMLLAESEGLHPIQAIRRFHVIEGRPSMRADAMQAEFQRRGGQIRWLKTSTEECEAEFSHPGLQPEPVNVRITYAEMDAAGITKGKFGVKDNWRKFPGAMLRARVVSAGVRMVDPGVVVGIYTPEEVSDFAPIEGQARVIDEPKDAHHAKHHDNQTGHGSGAYAPPAVVNDFMGWSKEYCDEINHKWLDGLTTESGEILEGPGEIINPWQLSGHILKWGRAQGGVDAPEEVRAGQRDKYAAVLWQKDQDAVKAEVRAYCRGLWKQAKAAIKCRALPVPAEITEDEAMDKIAEGREPGSDG